MHDQRAAIAANRFGLGARPQDAAAIGREPIAWLEAQLALEGSPAENTAGPPASATTLRRVTELRLARRVRAQARATFDRPSDNDTAASGIDRDMIREYAQFIGAQYREQTRARYERAILTERPFLERLVHFWSNHFAISTDKQPLGAIAGHYENEAIRPFVTGNFLTMLRAVERHPAMILYLDNQASIGPNSTAARFARRNRGREVGLNENLAREILELHTLGVDGGYTQADVTELARVLTGWSIGGEDGPLRGGDPGEFHFRALVHEPGNKTVLGTRFGETGIDEGESVLAMLARHPATARHLATKLARHFVADAPPAALIERMAGAYLESDGELLALYETLLESTEPWETPLAKFKTPHDLVISTYRALDHVPPTLARVTGILTQLGQAPLRPGSPAGWPDTAAQWDGGDALLKRIEWVAAVGQATGDRIDPVELGERILGPVLGEHSRLAVQRAESASQGLTLLFAAPEFQRR